MKRLFFFLLFLLPVLALSACAPVSLMDQAQLAKPEMSFEQTGAHSVACALTSQVEKGRFLRHASASGGCSSCH